MNQSSDRQPVDCQPGDRISFREDSPFYAHGLRTGVVLRIDQPIGEWAAQQAKKNGHAVDEWFTPWMRETPDVYLPIVLVDPNQLFPLWNEFAVPRKQFIIIGRDELSRN